MSEILTPETCPELGIEVPVGSIDKELRKLWEQDDAQTNASLMNLAIYCEREGSLVENSRIIRKLTSEHACRAILVEINKRTTQASLRAWITAHCHLSGGKKSICCEQVAFHLTGRVTGRFRNTVFSHLNSDLPLIFWWQGELSDVFTERLVAVMDRLIIDSSVWADPAAAFSIINEAAQANGDLILQDLAWTRSWQFRVGIAGLFDDPVAQAALPSVDRVEIIHHPDHRNSALQVLAWLAVQAGWEQTGATADAFAFRPKAGGEVNARLISDPESAPLGKVEIASEHVTVRVCREAGASHVSRQIQADGYLANSLSPADPDVDSELVGLQLSRGGKNSLYQKILPRFRAMLQ
ncbi:MAG: glucose-6-phosphate dehydrogenase assembly protein OpcA [Akkermansiaceae bacterium]|nr:glucose-6-phosphate dehydrogenase assembly protein OpcA [Akkermansiaceae bacterium]